MNNSTEIKDWFTNRLGSSVTIGELNVKSDSYNRSNPKVISVRKGNIHLDNSMGGFREFDYVDSDMETLKIFNGTVFLTFKIAK